MLVCAANTRGVRLRSDFSNYLAADALQDHHWRLYAHQLTTAFWPELPSRLDGRVHVALSCLDPLPTLVMVSNYTTQEMAEHAFMATGTAAEVFDGMLCSDGGAMSGPDMTPLFQDGQRQQLIVNLMKAGAPYAPGMAAGAAFNVTTYAALMRRGQDEAVQFLQTGAVSRDNKAITLCPVGANVKDNTCKQ